MRSNPRPVPDLHIGPDERPGPNRYIASKPNAGIYDRLGVYQRITTEWVPMILAVATGLPSTRAMASKR
ncbi:MAG: hypothetical protein ACREX3_05825, partial [Gammaproteobacteria bacterium]